MYCFIAACPSDQRRFGDYCYKELETFSQPFNDNANECLDMEGHLWYPENSQEMAFVRQSFPVETLGDVYHLGIITMSTWQGMNFTDGTFSPGIPFYTSMNLQTNFISKHLHYNCTFQINQEVLFLMT